MQKILGYFQERLENSEESLENFSNKKERKMKYKKKENLNVLPLTRGKQHYKTYTDFYVRSDGIKIVGKKDDVQECKECHKILPLGAFTTHDLRADGAYRIRKICRECSHQVWKEQRVVRKNAPPRPDRCDCCYKDKKLQVDHIHGTFTFRGWLCRLCNTGIGAVGDTLEGMLQAAIYLENDKDKIIEELHKVYGEIFGRTIEEQ